MVLNHRHCKGINTVLTPRIESTLEDQYADEDGGALSMVLDHHKTK
jgi:hypothetical protein